VQDWLSRRVTGRPKAPEAGSALGTLRELADKSAAHGRAMQHVRPIVTDPAVLKARIRELGKEPGARPDGEGHLKKATAFSRTSSREISASFKQHRGGLPVRLMCRAAGGSSRGFLSQAAAGELREAAQGVTEKIRVVHRKAARLTARRGSPRSLRSRESRCARYRGKADEDGWKLQAISSVRFLPQNHRQRSSAPDCR